MKECKHNSINFTDKIWIKLRRSLEHSSAMLDFMKKIYITITCTLTNLHKYAYLFYNFSKWYVRKYVFFLV